MGQDGEGGDTPTDQGDEPISPDDQPGWFDVDVNVAEERMGEEVDITQSDLYRTASDAFGVTFTAKNVSDAPLTNVTVHARLLGANDEVLGEWTASIAELESIDDLAAGEVWRGDIVFEDTDASTVEQDAVAVEIWATGEAEQGAADGTATPTEANGTTPTGTPSG